MLRYASDVRTLAYLAITIALAIVQWNLGTLHPVLYPLSLFMAVSIAVISHCHNHLGMWKWKPANLITNYVIAAFYGYPAIGWVPTHNQTHHKLVNTEGDTSRAPKVFKKNHLLALLIYPTLTGMEQSREIYAYIKGLYTKDKGSFWAAVSEYVVFSLFMLGLFLLDWRKALLFFVIPQQFALFMIQVFNYVQHVETADGSRWNHSRNFTSPVLNALLFNNGYHTIHHEYAGLHWSLTPAKHREIEKHIHPALLQRSWWGYMIWTFFVRPFVPGAKAPVIDEPKAQAA